MKTISRNLIKSGKKRFDIPIRGNILINFSIRNTHTYTHMYICPKTRLEKRTRWKVHFDRDARSQIACCMRIAQERIECNQLEAGRDTDESNPFVTRPRPARCFRVDSVPRDRNYSPLFNQGPRDFPRLRLREHVRFLNPAN